MNKKKFALIAIFGVVHDIFGLEVLRKLLSFIGREYLIFPSKSIDNK